VLASVSESGDKGVPVVLNASGEGEKEWRQVFEHVADEIWRSVQ
jgi:ATP-binding protein involved in chromosome partitioning